MKILIVDDEIVSRMKMYKIMTNFGDCDEAEGGSEAITAFTEAWQECLPYNLITLDISMPDMDGKETLSRIRAIEAEKKIPKEKQVKVIMVTANSDVNNFFLSVKSGCDEFIVKPFNRQRVIEKMQKIGFKV